MPLTDNVTQAILKSRSLDSLQFAQFLGAFVGGCTDAVGTWLRDGWPYVAQVPDVENPHTCLYAFAQSAKILLYWFGGRVKNGLIGLS